MSLPEGAGPAQYAAAIRSARDALVEWVQHCSDEGWGRALSEEDPRSVAIVVDHVADAYGYLGRFVTTLLLGEPLEVSSEIVDTLNEEHRERATGVTRTEAAAHLDTAGDSFADLVAGIDPGEFAQNARLARFAEIGIRHAHDHLAEVEAATS
jgi:hypothetical protein